MKKEEIITIIGIIAVFIVFSLYHTFKRSYYTVLKVENPFAVIVDKNNNGIIDANETINIKSDYKYITKNTLSDWKSLNLDNRTLYTFAYLTEKFAKDALLDKKVEIKIVNGREEILLNKYPYIEIFKKSGYLFKDGVPTDKSAYKRRLSQIKKGEYKIYNLKSNIYHLPDCEYGRQAHNFVLLAKYQLPKGAKPCKYCIDQQVKNKEHKHNNNIQSVPLVYLSGAIKVYLNDYTKNLIPNRKGNTNMCKELVSQINSAKSTIDIAVFGYDRVPKIETALNNAIKRGVQVRLVYDVDSKGNNIYANTFELSRIIKNCSSDSTLSTSTSNSYSNALMHNKFYIFDNSVIITGSTNLSHTDMSDYNANCMVLINSNDVAKIYSSEFEQLYNHKFHNKKQRIYNKENININNNSVSVYFSPKDDIANKVFIPIINTAEKYIYIPVFIITHKGIADALVKAKKRGVDVKLIVDATNAKNSHSMHKYLRQNGILVKTETYAGKLHSKSIIIDDKYTIIGSMNFSRSGNSYNDENVLVIKDSKLTKFYKTYFLYIWSKISNYWLTHDVAAESIYSTGSCSDGIDNDYDGKTDSEDEGCKYRKKN